ncbi:hypothetical protein KY342_04605 [Candidatus Woesearchaeota archaeon]|nr:hypothetical protein [Candidatus Woesearchaeota archaeon]
MAYYYQLQIRTKSYFNRSKKPMDLIDFEKRPPNNLVYKTTLTEITRETYKRMNKLEQELN